mmetsp:Transcript_23873/g.54345  ORF Transcript_23873/g.54345 Transcript_23873/m.54345 type:complete len:299 (-) Transcript_23873:1320-2216(-)
MPRRPTLENRPHGHRISRRPPPHRRHPRTRCDGPHRPGLQKWPDRCHQRIPRTRLRHLGHHAGPRRKLSGPDGLLRPAVPLAGDGQRRPVLPDTGVHHRHLDGELCRDGQGAQSRRTDHFQHGRPTVRGRTVRRRYSWYEQTRYDLRGTNDGERALEAPPHRSGREESGQRLSHVLPPKNFHGRPPSRDRREDGSERTLCSLQRYAGLRGKDRGRPRMRARGGRGRRGGRGLLLPGAQKRHSHADCVHYAGGSHRRPPAHLHQHGIYVHVRPRPARKSHQESRGQREVAVIPPEMDQA